MRFGFICVALCFAFPVKADPAQIPAHDISFAYAVSDSSGPPADYLASDLQRYTSLAVTPISFQPRPLSRPNLCSAAAWVATENNLPIPFFANLIEQESGFQPHVVSRAGAQGIAQFMPRVAAAYGLNNPFDPFHALTVSGRFLAELVSQFGNLGLAAAAYNAGPTRVQKWMVRGGKLPSETHHYVQRITGRPIEQWAKQTVDKNVRLPAHARCYNGRIPESQAAEHHKPSAKFAARVKTVPGTALLPAVKNVALVAQQRRAKSRTVVAAGSKARSQFVTGPAAKRFALMKTPVIIVPEKTRSKRIGAVNAALSRNSGRT